MSPSSPRVVLAQCTNTIRTPQTRLTPYLPTPPTDLKKPKRRHVGEHKPVLKRQKFDAEDTSSSDSDSDGDVFMADMVQPLARKKTAFQRHRQVMMDSASRFQRHAPSTLPILKSFVSSNKSDLFKCQSVAEDTYLTPPYACSYAHRSKAGETPLLAVATEQGTVHVLNTSRRNDWDTELQRITLQPHNNGIFDVKWSNDDASLATCSGDQSTRISSSQTGAITHVLRGHNSTVKCMAWDPINPSLLATGGRDGAICLWDLRVGQHHDDGNVFAATPVITIHGAHEDTIVKSKPKPRKGKQNPAPRTITNLLYPESQSNGLVSSGSFDGILRYWDLRKPTSLKKTKTSRLALPSELYISPIDPTTLHGSRRSRGIISMTAGTGPSAGLIFGLGADSRIHTYDFSTLTAQRNMFAHENLQASSFYVGLSVSPCGRWLACGGSSHKGNSFLFDVENAARPGSRPQQGIELQGQKGEVGAVDWAQDMLATCTDDGTVRIWRPDIDTRMKCIENPEESRWDWSWSVS